MSLRVEQPYKGSSAEIHKYTRTAVILHWLIAALIIVNIALGLCADRLPEGWQRPVVDLHKSIGLTVLGLALVRLGWRFFHRPPALSADFARYEIIAARISHILLYAVMFLLPLTGWIHDSAWAGAATHPLTLYGFIPWFRIGFIEALAPATKDSVHRAFGLLHTCAGYLLYGLLALHIAATVKHHMIDKKKLIQRMWF